MSSVKKNNNNEMTKEQHVADALRFLADVYNYNHWIYKNIRRFIGEDILEIGSGIGNITDFLMHKPRLTLIDNDPQFVSYLKDKYFFRTEEHCRIHCLDIERIENSPISKLKYDTIICLNVLEHIKNDKTTFDNMVSLLAAGGRLILLVPASPLLYGSMDITYGHLRRYTKKALLDLAAGHDASVLKCSYMNLLGAFGWFFNARVLRRKTIPGRQAVLFDKIVPLLSVVERVIPPPFGSALIFIFEKW